VYFSIIKKIAIVLFLTAFPISAFAAGLGSVNVTSALGEPLNASIELLSMTPAELASLQAKIDSEAAYVEQGLTRLAVHDEIKLRISKDAGNNILKLTSNSAIADPVLDLLVVVEWSNGRISRQYTVLLDPPSYNPAATQTQIPATNQFDNASIKKTNTNSANQSQSATSPAQEHLTKKGDTLYKVARRMQPAGVDLDKVLVALFEANPEAFDGKNMNRLKVGKILQAPSESALNAMTDQHANSEIKLQAADWNKYRNKLAEAVAQKAAQANDEDMQSSSGKINSAAEDKSALADASKDVVKLSTANTNEMNADTQAKLTALQEEVSAREKGLKEAEDRTAALEKQIEDMQKLLALKNNAMLNAQEQSAQNEAVTKAEDQLEQDKSEITTEAADKDTAQPLEAQKPAVASSKKVATPEIKQPSFFVSLLDTAVDKFNDLNKLLLLGVAGILALLVVIWLYIRNKRNKQLQDFEQGIMTSGSLKANTVFGDTASGMVATGDTSFLTDFSHSTSNALIDTNDVDPIAEAEVYMAYGRDAQAEEILKDAISKEPQRYELYLKLLEMYAANKNTTAFEAVAGEMFTTLGSNNPTWIKVAEMGAKLESANPLYQLKVSSENQPAELKVFETKPDQPNLPQPDSVSTQSVQAELTEVNPATNEEVEGELDASDFSDSPLAAEVDLDFSISDNADVNDVMVAGLDVEPVEKLGQLEDEVAMSKNEPALQFDLNNPDEIEEVAKSVSDLPSLDFPTFETKSTGEDEIADSNNELAKDVGVDEIELSLDSSIMDEARSNEMLLDSSEDNADDNFDFGDDNETNQNELDMKNANILDVSGISLDIGDEVSFATDSESEQDEGEEATIEEPMTPADEEVETKLELVAAYIDMEDKDGAKELLEEVLKEGNLSQRKRADQILASLA
jgi:pilus assembly protein FimV